MYIYTQSEPQLFTVGHYSDGKWHAESDHRNAEDAARRVAWLNGSREPRVRLEIGKEPRMPMEALRREVDKRTPEGVCFLSREEAAAILKEHARLRNIELAWQLLPSAQKLVAEDERDALLAGNGWTVRIYRCPQCGGMCLRPPLDDPQPCDRCEADLLGLEYVVETRQRLTEQLTAIAPYPEGATDVHEGSV